MLSFATLLARNTWYLVLIWMRQPWMRRIHLMPMRRMNEVRAHRFYDNYKRQNRLARKIGLPLLRVAFFILIASMILQVSVFIILRMNERGWLAPQKLESHRLTDE